MTMDRKLFFNRMIALGICPLVLTQLNQGFANETNSASLAQGNEDQPSFVENWLTDLLNTIEKTVDRETQVKIIEGCGRGCFKRHQFKKDIAAKGEGNLDKLIEAYKANFEIWKDDEGVHVRYGKRSSRCYCPVVKHIPPKPNDLHCECTKATHQSIFETALNKKVQVEIIESLRRGGQTCHFLVHV